MSNESKTVYTNTRPATTPGLEGSHITVEASVDRSVVGLSWQRDDAIARGGRPTMMILPIEELLAITEAVKANMLNQHPTDLNPSVVTTEHKGVR